MKILSVSFMLFYEQYLTTTGPDSNLNWKAIDIKTLYALMNSSFWIETINLGGPLYTSMDHRLLFRNKIAFSFSEDCFCLSKQIRPWWNAAF